MRVAQIIPYRLHPYSGVRGAVVGLSCALAHRALDVEVWHLDAWPEPAYDLLEELQSERVERVDFSKYGFNWRLHSAIRQRIVQRKVELVYLHGAFSPLNNILARLLPVPYVLTPHGGCAAAVLHHRRIRKTAFKYLFEMPLLRGAAALCALSEAERDEFPRFGFTGPVDVAAYGIGPAPKTLNAKAFRTELGFEEGVRLAIFVGRLDIYYKNLEVLVRGMEQATDWHLVLVGPDFRGGHQYLETLIRRSQLEARVHLVGPRRGHALHEAMASADLFILISRSEGLPAALLEALGHGVPALVSPAVERAVGVATAGAGWTVSPEGLGRQLEALATLDSQTWREHQIEAKRLSARFAWDKVIARHEEIARRAVSAPPVTTRKAGRIP